uniref:Ig-like domain-containing protein n=1 Tax=Varanus komodoensis TaxID=61221 RepID=A0A8D2J363_VARKO
LAQLNVPLRKIPYDLKALKVSIAKYPPVRAMLAGSLTIPCHVTYLRPLPMSGTSGRLAVQGAPRVKWTFLTEGKEVEILVAQGQKVKVNEGYHDRVSLPFYPDSPTDATLVLNELRSNDSGIYRCDVQHGIEDGHDLLEVKVKGNIYSLHDQVGTRAWILHSHAGTPPLSRVSFLDLSFVVGNLYNQRGGGGEASAKKT